MTVTAHVNAPMEQLERKVNPKHVWWLFDSLPSSFAVLAVPCYTLTAVTQVGLATREQFARICVFYYQIWISERTVRLQICRVVRFHERIILIRNTHSVSVLLPLSAFVFFWVLCLAKNVWKSNKKLLAKLNYVNSKKYQRACQTKVFFPYF